MKRLLTVAKACAVAGALACCGVVTSTGDAQAVVVRTSISLADFKSAFDVSSVRRLFDNGNGRGTDIFIQRFNSEGLSFRKFGGTVDLSKSFIFFRVSTPPNVDPVSAAFSVRVQPGEFSAANPPVILTCTAGGSGAEGVTSLTCGSGPTVSPS